MEITTQRFERCAVVKPSGRLDAATAPRLAKTFDEIFQQGLYNIVLDMGEVDFISSVGLRVMIDAQKACRRLNRGELVVANVSAHVHKALELAGYYTLFKVYDTVLEGAGSI